MAHAPPSPPPPDGRPPSRELSSFVRRPSLRRGRAPPIRPAARTCASQRASAEASAQLSKKSRVALEHAPGAVRRAGVTERGALPSLGAAGHWAARGGLHLVEEPGSLGRGQNVAPSAHLDRQNDADGIRGRSLRDHARPPARGGSTPARPPRPRTTWRSCRDGIEAEP